MKAKIQLMVAVIATTLLLVSCGKAEKKDNKQENVKNKTEQIAKTGNEVSSENDKAKEYKKPVKYPEISINELKESFVKDGELSKEKLDKINTVWETIFNYKSDETKNLKDPNEAFKKELNNISMNGGFKNWGDFLRQTTVIATGMALLPLLNNMEETKGKNDVSYGMAKDMANSMISQGHVSQKDLQFIYDNWSKCAEVMLELDKFKK